MCDPLTAFLVGSFIVDTGVGIHESTQTKKANKTAQSRVREKADLLEGKRKDALATRESGLSKAITSTAAGSSSAIKKKAPISTNVQKLGSSDLFRRTLG